MMHYRQIYEQHYGSIPRDEENRSYDIHHIDGNHSNNCIENLKAVSIQEHYDIHLSQGDYGSCFCIMLRMNKTPEELSEMAKKNNAEQIKNKTHPFLGPRNNQLMIEKGTHPFLDRKAASIRQKKRVKEETHHFLGGEIQKETTKRRIKEGTHNFLKENGGSERARNTQLKRVEEGTHVFLGGEIVSETNRRRLEDRTHHLLSGDIQRKANNKRVEEGTHVFLGGDIQREMNKKKVEDKTHPFLKENIKQPIENGTHTSQFKWICERCGKVGKSKGMYFRWHGNNCKKKD